MRGRLKQRPGCHRVTEKQRDYDIAPQGSTRKLLVSTKRCVPLQLYMRYSSDSGMSWELIKASNVDSVRWFDILN